MTVNKHASTLARSIILGATDNNLDVMEEGVLLAYDAIVSITDEETGDLWMEQTGAIFRKLINEYVEKKHGKLKFMPKENNIHTQVVGAFIDDV